MFPNRLYIKDEHLDLQCDTMVHLLLQTSAPAKFIFNISCILVIFCIPLRFLNLQTGERVLVAFAAPCSWAFLLFFARSAFVHNRNRLLAFNRLLKRRSIAKSRAPAMSRALRRIRGRLFEGWTAFIHSFIHPSITTSIHQSI